MNKTKFGAWDARDEVGADCRTGAGGVGAGALAATRRRWLQAVLGGALVSRCGQAWGRAAGASANDAQGDVQSFRVKSVLELRGEVRLKAQGVQVARKDGKQLVARTAPVQCTSTLEFEEQYRVHPVDERTAGVQHFEEALSEITVDQHTTKTLLREPCREVVRLGTANGMLTAAPGAPLFAAERDLIEGTVTTMFIDQILTDREVAVTDKWDVNEAMVCRLLNLDAIQDGKLTVCLVDSDAAQAQLALQGQLTALVRDVATEIVLTGKAVLEREAGYVSWLALKIEETREIGEAEPGFKVQAQVRVRRARIEELSTGRSLEEALQDAPSRSAAALLQFQSDLGFYRFLADRRWSTYRDNGEEATLRFIVNNRLMAQCNVTNLVDFEAGRQLSLEGFQSDIRRLIANSGGEILEASERVSATSHRVLKIVASGNAEGVPIRWLHYHLSNDDGRRLSLVFTLDEDSLEAFAEQDSQIVDSLELLAWPRKLDSAALESATTESGAVDLGATETEPARPVPVRTESARPAAAPATRSSAKGTTKRSH